MAANQMTRRRRSGRQRKDPRWKAPLPVIGSGRSPWRFDGRWDYDNVDQFRHVRCVHYDACLDDACRECKGNTTWACPKSCPGRKTRISLELSEELRSYNWPA